MTSIIDQVKQDTNYSKRTQISLSPTLRKVVEQKIKREGVSLSAYIREALAAHLAREEHEKRKRMEAVRDFVGSGNEKDYPEWSSEEKVIQWQREIRKDPPRLDT